MNLSHGQEISVGKIKNFFVIKDNTAGKPIINLSFSTS